MEPVIFLYKTRTPLRICVTGIEAELGTITNGIVRDRDALMEKREPSEKSFQLGAVYDSVNQIWSSRARCCALCIQSRVLEVFCSGLIQLPDAEK